VGKVLGRLRASVAEKTDKRLKCMVELISGIFLVKISAWEQHYTDLIEKARRFIGIYDRFKCMLQLNIV